MKKIELLIFFSLILNFCGAQISFYGAPQVSYLSNENQSGLGIELGIENRINSKWNWGISFNSNFTESRGILPSAEGNAIPINDSDDSNPLVNACPCNTALYQFESKPDQSQITAVSIFVRRQVKSFKHFDLQLTGGIGGYFVNLQKVEAIYYPTYVEETFGEYTGEEPFVLPVFSYQTFLDPGVNLGVHLNRKLSERIQLGLIVKNHWLPISGLNLMSGGVSVNVNF